tara:strand:+ start:4224 stop:5060 length:837 start_codon:yes stop_codon:yes gene_type:complete
MSGINAATIPEAFYGDQYRWWFGIVVNPNDPQMLGRMQVRIYGVHPEDVADLESEDLPWAQTMIPTTEGGVSGIGKMGRLLPGAKVIGMFLDGPSSQVPFIMGAVHTIEDPSPVQIEKLAASEDKSLTNQSFISAFFNGSTNAEICFNFFLANEFTPEQAAAMVGNFSVESGTNVNPLAAKNNNYGIAQWQSIETAGNRFVLLKSFAGQRNLNWQKLNTQLMFVLNELRTYSYLGLNKLLKAENIEQATRRFAESYIRRDTLMTTRITYAKDTLERLG